MNDFFKPAGDLDSPKSNFRLSEDLTTKSIKDKIEDYILTVASGKKYEAISELGVLCGGGKIIVTFEKFQEMVNDGYNIISAKCINTNMIEVEFQQFKKDKIEGRVR